EAEAMQVVGEIVAGGGRAVSIRADVSREEQIIRMFETAERELGPIKGLVNNAGHGRVRTGGRSVERGHRKRFRGQRQRNNLVFERSSAAHVDAAGRHRRSNREYFFACSAHGSGGGVGTLCDVQGRDRQLHDRGGSGRGGG